MFQQSDTSKLIMELCEEEWSLRRVCKMFRDLMDALFPPAERVLNGMIRKLLYDIYLHPVRLELVYKPRTDWDFVPFPAVTRLSVWSMDIGNDDKDVDHRGGGCGHLRLPVADFNYSIANPTGITAQNIAECVYRLKGSKYDLWYELFCKIKHLKFEDDELLFEVIFDYGS